MGTFSLYITFWSEDCAPEIKILIGDAKRGA